MDDYGVGASAMAGLEVYARAARGSGRTTRLINSLKGGETVICHTTKEADRLRREVMVSRPEIKKTIAFIVPEHFHPLGARRSARGGGPLVFTEQVVEEMYRRALNSLAEDFAEVGAERSGIPSEPPGQDLPPIYRPEAYRG